MNRFGWKGSSRRWTRTSGLHARVWTNSVLEAVPAGVITHGGDSHRARLERAGGMPGPVRWREDRVDEPLAVTREVNALAAKKSEPDLKAFSDSIQLRLVCGMLCLCGSIPLFGDIRPEARPSVAFICTGLALYAVVLMSRDSCRTLHMMPVTSIWIFSSVGYPVLAMVQYYYSTPEQVSLHYDVAISFGGFAGLASLAAGIITAMLPGCIVRRRVVAALLLLLNGLLAAQAHQIVGPAARNFALQNCAALAVGYAAGGALRRVSARLDVHDAHAAVAAPRTEAPRTEAVPHTTHEAKGDGRGSGGARGGGESATSDAALRPCDRGDFGPLLSGGALTIGDFERLGLLGSGGSATVFLCRPRSDAATGAEAHTLVALKMVRRRGGERAAARVRSEIAITAALRHPYIVELLAAFEDTHSFCLALTYAGGGDLRARLAESDDGTVAEAVAVRLISEVTCALGFLHGRNGASHALT